MKLFAYYALHSFINQVRKLFKTWVIAFILVCALGGGLIGYFIGTMTDSEDAVVEEGTEEEMAAEDAAPAEEDPSEAGFAADPAALIELVLGGIILATLVVTTLGADKSGSKIFLPADVPILFASPLRPQAVLLFRLVTKLGMAVLASIYFLFEIPVLTSEMGIPLGTVLIFLGVWILTLVTAMLLQTFLYSYCTTHARLKPYISRVVYGLLLVLTVGFIVYQRKSGLSWMPAAFAFFNAPWSRFIPVWGWLKGIGCFALAGNLPLLFLCLCLSLGVIAGLAVLLRRSRADFYEEALSHTQETAERLQAIEDSQSTGTVLLKRKKDRSDRLRRDGLKGQGAAMFFHRSLYNRFRFAHLGFLTKTAETYLVAGIATALFSRYSMQRMDFTMVGLSLAALAFFRAMGNPLSEDTNMPWFRLVPEPSWKKLGYSVLGGTTNCMLDVLIGLIPAAVILKADPATVLGWLVFTISVDLYATTVGTFIDLSIPFSSGKLVKQLVQVLFIYFGLIPDAGILFVFHRNGHFLAGTAITFVVNLLLGTIFLALTVRPLEPTDKVFLQPVELSKEELKQARRTFSRVGFSFAAIFLVTFGLQILLMVLAKVLEPSWSNAGWMPWLVSFVPMYLVAVPIGILLLKKIPAVRPQDPERWSLARLAVVFPICLFLMYCGSLFGVFINWLVGLLIPTAQGANPVAEMIDLSDSLIWRVLFMVILAPVIEEFLFRRQIIDRIRVYGERRAILVSAVMFGLFHGNLSQMFYAGVLGLVFGYVYLKTGKLRYSIILHALINFMGSILAPELLSSLDLAAESVPVPAVIYLVLLCALSYLGLLLFILRSRFITYRQAQLQQTNKKGFILTWTSVGMLVFTACCLFQIILNL